MFGPPRSGNQLDLRRPTYKCRPQEGAAACQAAAPVYPRRVYGMYVLASAAAAGLVLLALPRQLQFLPTRAGACDR